MDGDQTRHFIAQRLMPDVHEERERRRVEGIRQGDEKSLESLFRAYFDDLCEFAQYHVGSSEAAEDLVQNIFCDLWDRRRSWRPKGTVQAYLYRAVRNKSLDWLKHQRVRRQWEGEQEAIRRPIHAGPEDLLQHTELVREMEQAVADLPERRRLVYTMIRHQNMSYAEVAAALNISKKTVENQMGRAMKFLRERLATFRSVA